MEEVSLYLGVSEGGKKIFGDLEIELENFVIEEFVFV